MFKITTARLLIATALVFGGLVLLLVTGALNFLADDRSVGSDAVSCVIAYWGAVTLLIVIVSAAKNRPKELALAVFSLAVTLVLSEVAVRVAGLDRAKMPFGGLKSSTVHHIYPRDVEMFMGKFDGRSVVVRTNEDGIRSDYSRDEFLAKKRRILLLGDSFALGLGVRQEEMCGAVLERELRAQAGTDDIAVATGALISYSPLLERELYRKRLREYAPNLVMVILDASDFGDDYKYTTEIVQTEPEVRFDLPDEKASTFYVAIDLVTEPFQEWVRTAIMYPYYRGVKGGRRTYDYYDFELEIGGAVERNRFFIYRHPVSELRPHFERTVSYVNDIAREVQAAGGRFVLVVTPRYHHWSDRECPHNWEVRLGEYTIEDPHEFAYFEFFEEVSPGLDYDVVSLLPAFQQTDEFPLVFSFDPHWNAAGHAFVGRELARHARRYIER